VVPPEQLLTERRRELETFLARIEQTLAAVVPVSEMSGQWVKRLQAIVHAEVKRLEERLAGVGGDLPRKLAELGEIERLIERIATETLAFVGGVTARSLGIDGGLCDWADALLAAVAEPMLQGYQPIALPSGSEFIDVVSEVIRVRYPGVGIWDLPVVLHEFGHFLVRRLPPGKEPSVSSVIRREREPLDECGGLREVPYLGAFAEELWADTFATYVAGPAYAFSALDRMDPTTACDDQMPSHPSAVRRSGAILSTLDHLQDKWVGRGRVAGSLAVPVALVSERWRSRLAAAGVSTDAREPERQHASALAAEFVAILDRDSPAVRYDDGRVAAEIQHGLDIDEPSLPAGAGLVDLLNGAWWARYEAETQMRQVRVDKIGRAVKAMCLEAASNE
jgi:hypothetical protein